ncbi:MAG: site-specific integrase [Gallionellaceae bacterium]|nr:site-specific integrase [Gallionellaceae bacterium]
MNRVDIYLNLAERPNTRRCYAAAVRHFEVEWHGLLPATPSSIASYLAEYATSLSINTLRAKLAGLSRWHMDHGFSDPTKSDVVNKVLKGIRAAHSTPEKQARPLELEQLEQICDWFEQASHEPEHTNNHAFHLRQARDRAMLLVGFWRGFRADELTSLIVENITVEQGEGMTIYLPRSKGDREFTGRSFHCPALSRLCPVTAYENWIKLSGLSTGPVFRRIDRWGNIGNTGVMPGSVIPWLRGIFKIAGLEAPESYSSHSLRRGFSGWARTSGWDIKELMEYVGWKDVKSAMRYLDVTGDDLKARFEKGLKTTPTESRCCANSATSDVSNITMHAKPVLKIIK